MSLVVNPSIYVYFSFGVRLIWGAIRMCSFRFHVVKVVA